MPDHGSLVGVFNRNKYLTKNTRYERQYNKKKIPAVRVEGVFSKRKGVDLPDLTWRFYLRAELWGEEDNLPTEQSRRTLGVLAMNPARALRSPALSADCLDETDITVSKIMNFVQFIHAANNSANRFHVLELVNCYPVYAKNSEMLRTLIEEDVTRSSEDKVSDRPDNLCFIKKMFRRADQVVIATGVERFLHPKLSEIFALSGTPNRVLVCNSEEGSFVPHHYGKRGEQNGTLKSASPRTVLQSFCVESE